MFMPFFDLASVGCMYALWQGIDKAKVRCRKGETAAKTVRAYIEIVSGPNIMINQRYASSLTVVFVCFMYGTAMPVLFWFALVYCILKYFCDKFLLVFVYRKPPMLDDALHNRTLRIFHWVVVIFALNSYWMLSNRQLFGNDVHARRRMSDIEATGHSIFEPPTGHALFLLVVAVLVLVIVLAVQLLFTCSFFVETGERKELAKVEDLGNYFRCLYRRELESMIKEEETLRSYLGFKKMTDRQLKKLRGALIN